ncbi:MAG TPA: iron ABC transporter permease [Burkholderiaceae bacterium]|nr:iron ABC transporter permease [Burkholderiaceae bacterium]
MRLHSHHSVWIAMLACVVACVTAVMAGSVTIDWHAMALGVGDPIQRSIVWDVRMPRVVLAALCGAALAVAGTAMQALFRNPLADPALTGVSSGAAIGAIGAIVLGADAFTTAQASLVNIAPYLQPLAAFAGALATTGLLLMYTRRDTVATLLLAGVGVNALAGATIGALTWIADDAKLRNLAFWMLGSFGGAHWTLVAATAPWLVLPIVVLPKLARAMNALLLGEIEAGYLGYAVGPLKLALLALTALAVGAAVAAAGMVGFIGLVVPHMVRTLTGPDHTRVVPVVAFFGATLAVLADLAARWCVAPAELPVGVLLAALGAPMFLWLLKRQPRA